MHGSWHIQGVNVKSDSVLVFSSAVGANNQQRAVFTNIELRLVGLLPLHQSQIADFAAPGSSDCAEYKSSWQPVVMEGNSPVSTYEWRLSAARREIYLHVFKFGDFLSQHVREKYGT